MAVTDWLAYIGRVPYINLDSKLWLNFGLQYCQMPVGRHLWMSQWSALSVASPACD